MLFRSVRNQQKIKREETGELNRRNDRFPKYFRTHHPFDCINCEPCNWPLSRANVFGEFQFFVPVNPFEQISVCFCSSSCSDYHRKKKRKRGRMRSTKWSISARKIILHASESSTQFPPFVRGIRYSELYVIPVVH